MDSLAIKLGINIRTTRLEKGLSQDALALACGLDRSYMGRIERGKVNITVEKLYIIAENLNVQARDLLPNL